MTTNQVCISVHYDLVIYNNVVTSQGLGCCLQFAIELGESLFGLRRATQVSNQLLVDRAGKMGFRRKMHKDMKQEIPYEYKEEENEEVPTTVGEKEAESDQAVGSSLETVAAMGHRPAPVMDDDESLVEPPGTG
jgi:hypothetical protein